MQRIENYVGTPEAIASHILAGQVAARALQHGAKQIKAGASMRAILDSVEEYILSHGCGIAFPAQSSVNNVAAHYCPTDAEDIIYQDGDLVKMDVGAHHNGYIGDTAITVSIGGKDQALVEAANAALDAAQAVLRPGCTPNDVGRAIHTAITGRGFQPIRNLSGHGLGRYQIHTSPGMPNYATGESRPLVEGQAIAIEPFATDGTSGLIYNGTAPTVFVLGEARPVRSPAAKETLKLIQTYNGLPFTTRWLTRKLGSKALIGLSELRRAGMLHEYPPLLEKSKGLVAQREKSFLITKDGCKVLTEE
jgi:methionyl aminopeptidase